MEKADVYQIIADSIVLLIGVLIIYGFSCTIIYSIKECINYFKTRNNE